MRKRVGVPLATFSSRVVSSSSASSCVDWRDEMELGTWNLKESFPVTSSSSSSSSSSGISEKVMSARGVAVIRFLGTEKVCCAVLAAEWEEGVGVEGVFSTCLGWGVFCRGT